MALWDLFLDNKGRKIHKWTHYFPIYEVFFRTYVNKPILIIEIGCGRGGSLQLWKKYFGPHARIVGVDINPDCKAFEEDQINIRIGDQNDPVFLRSLIDEFGTPDLILDDGSHVMEHIKTSFSVLYPLLDRNGVYLVEDLHTAYWEEFGGGLRRDGTFIEFSKNLVDELNAEHARGALESTEFTRGTSSIHFYDSVVVFQKGMACRKHAPIIGLVE